MSAVLADKDISFGQILTLVRERTGTNIPDTNYRHARRIIAQRCADLQTHVDLYPSILARNSVEFQNFINLIAISETYFFREERQFALLKQRIIPEILNSSKRALAWSATCSSGEEPLSLAILFEEGKRDGGEYQIYATDINTLALEHFQSGVYGKNSFREDGSSFHNTLRQYGTQGLREFHISKDLMRRISISAVNLYSDSLDDLPEGFHLIFFRNTLIYMDLEIKEKVLSSVIRKLSKGGYLFLSSTEIPLILHSDLKLENEGEVYYFRKTASVTVSLPAPNRTAPPETPERAERSPEHAASPRDKIIRMAPDCGSVMTEANRISTGVPGDYYSRKPEHLTAELILYVLYFISRMDYLSAERVLSYITGTIFSNSLTHYLLGFIRMFLGDKLSALDSFREAQLQDPEFWPAFFYAGTLLADSNSADAAACFRRSAEMIETQMKNQPGKYHFLMENFSEKYFRGICLEWIAKLGETSI